jgi:hypothetical protein
MIAIRKYRAEIGQLFNSFYDSDILLWPLPLIDLALAIY